MLNEILPYLAKYTGIIASVTGIDIEVVNADLLRIAGTGSYASGVGSSIHEAGQIYRHVLASGETVFMDNPKEHALCLACASRNTCRETLSLATPIVYGDMVLGVIGLVCFTMAERERVLAMRHVFQDFVLQISQVISREVQAHQNLMHTRKRLDMLMRIVDGNSRGVLVLDADGHISYVNETAAAQLGIVADTAPGRLSLTETGDALSGLDEFTLSVDGRECAVMGHLSRLDDTDPTFSQVLVFDSLPRFAEMLSHATPSAEETGGLAAIIGSSRSLKRLKSKVRRIAETSSTVLIAGESGTGKELFARAIHAASDRRDKPFIAINCGAIPDALLESELFGYVRGAFTGASPGGRMGKFELAHQGVLFLDEISSLPLYLQVKLLRVLQERQITRLGSNRLVDVDVRIIAASNDDLAALVEQGMFRDDLYYRLNVVPFEIPSLRDRREDIPELAAYFLERYCARFGKKPLRLSAAVLDALQAYHWPGNVREFENVMEYLVNVAPDGGPVFPSMLPAKIRASVNGQAVAPETQRLAVPDGILNLEAVERIMIKKALDRFGHDGSGKRRAAEALGIGVATLYRKLK